METGTRLAWTNQNRKCTNSAQYWVLTEESLILNWHTQLQDQPDASFRVIRVPNSTNSHSAFSETVSQLSYAALHSTNLSCISVFHKFLACLPLLWFSSPTSLSQIHLKTLLDVHTHQYPTCRCFLLLWLKFYLYFESLIQVYSKRNSFCFFLNMPNHYDHSIVKSSRWPLCP